jgi:hypothetical protein
MQPIIQRYHKLSGLIMQIRSPLETVWKDLGQEQTLVAELNIVLAQLFSATHISPWNSDTSGSQSFRSGPLFASSQPMSSSELSSYLDEQIQLLEKAQQLCAQLDQQKKQSLQELKRLTGLLPGTTAVPIPGTVASRGANKNEKEF